MAKFIRSTHDISGDLKPHFRIYGTGINYAVSDAWDKCGFIVHMLDSTKSLSFDDLCNEVDKYIEDYKEEPMTKEKVALELVLALEWGFASTVEE